MLLNNYYEYKKMMFSGENAYGGTYRRLFTWVTGSMIGGNNSPNIYANSSYQGDLGYWLLYARCTKFPTALGGTCGIFFGTGTTPATLADYTLEAPIESGLTITNPTTYTFNDDGAGKWTYSASYVLTNTTEADINIYEIGIVTKLAQDSTVYPTLMERTVLTEPITVPAGGAKLLTLKLTQNNVLNVEA